VKDYLKNIIIGIFTIAAIVSLVSLILFLKPSIGDEKKTLNVRFSNISGIGIGTRVTFAGRPVGEVKAIHEIYNAREEPTDPLGRVYFYQLTLKIDSSVQVYNTDEITIQTTGLMGEKTVAIIPKAPHKGKIPKPITEDQVVYADSIDPLENALTHFSDMSEKIEHLVSDVDEWFIENGDDLSQAITSFSNSMNQLDTALGSVNEEELVKKITEAVTVAKSDLELIQSTLQEIQQSDTVGKFNNLVDGFTEVAGSFNTQGKQIMQNMTVITNDIADGTGSLGKFIKSDDFYLRVSAIMSKVNTLMNDLNHYGLLFQYDKHWQRSRTKKANILEALDSPRDFRSYFDNEMDSITTALARLTILMEKAQQPGEKDKVLSSDAFKSDFNLLMNEVQDLYDTIKLYNEELIDNQQNACN
jgi:phospholipid/cholesterol/gamma-HCH transport system substrate-binding protein